MILGGLRSSIWILDATLVLLVSPPDLPPPYTSYTTMYTSALSAINAIRLTAAKPNDGELGTMGLGALTCAIRREPRPTPTFSLVLDNPCRRPRMPLACCEP